MWGPTTWYQVGVEGYYSTILVDFKGSGLSDLRMAIAQHSKLDQASWMLLLATMGWRKNLRMGLRIKRLESYVVGRKKPILVMLTGKLLTVNLSQKTPDPQAACL